MQNSVEVTAPGYAMLDLKNVADAVQYPLEAHELTTYRSIGHHTVGYGPPFVKFDQTSAPIAINKPSPQKLADAAAAKLSPPLSLTPRPYLADRPLSIAAQTIAARKSMMSDELRKSEPALKSVFDEKPAGSANSKDAADDDIKLQSRLVNLALTVTDRDGRAITNLKPEDLKVFEDGVQQPIYHFSTEQTGFNLILLLDMSGSTHDKRELIKAAALHFISLINPADKVAVISFTTDVIVVSHLTQDRDALGNAIAGTSLPTGGTAFYDALGYALVEELRTVKGQRNAVVVLTDGEDNSIAEDWVRRQSHVKIDPMMPHRTGSFLTFDELLDGVKEADAMIYPIYLGPGYIQISTSASGSSSRQPTVFRMDGEVADTAKKQLLELADVSGGRVFDANRIEELKGVYEQVAAELRTVYYLAYTPTNQSTDGKFRRIVVKVNNPTDAVARTRKGYYAR